MQPEFYDVYRDLNEIYKLAQYDFRYIRDPRLIPNVFDLRTVDDAITETGADLGLARALRPDAKLLLLVNFHQMVALPLAYADRLRTLRKEGPRGEQLPVDEIIRHDVRTLLQTAREESKEEEISGHAILSAASRVWQKLRASGLDVWG